MSIPPEIAWLIPVVLPFIIGLLVGAIVKKGFKLLIAVVALIIVLVATGIMSLTFTDLFDATMNFCLSSTMSGTDGSTSYLILPLHS